MIDEFVLEKGFIKGKKVLSEGKGFLYTNGHGDTEE